MKQILTTLEIVIPFPLLFSMFSNGITVMMSQPTVKERDTWKEKDGGKEKVKVVDSDKILNGGKGEESLCRSSICKYKL